MARGATGTHPAGGRTLRDDLGRTLRLPTLPQRVVSLVPSLTDLVFALGAGDRVVGVSDVCDEPRGRLGGIARVGSEKKPDLDAIKALRPDLVLANKEENRRDDVDRMADAGLAVHVSFPRTVEDGARLCQVVGDLLGVRARGRALAAAVRRARAAAHRMAPRPERPAAVLIWRDPWLTLGADTYGHDVLTLCGLRNVFGGSTAGRRYPKVTLLAVARLAPAIVLLPDEPYAFDESDRAEVARAVPGARVLLCSGRPLFWHGPRAVDIPALARLVAGTGVRAAPA